MHLRSILAALPILALVHVVACSDQVNDQFPSIPGNTPLGDGGDAPDGATTPATITSKKLCMVTKAGDGGKVISGTLLLPDAPIAGEVFIDANGVIQCAAESCSGTDGYDSASRIACTNAVVSPGLINPHDHIPYAATPPQGHGDERFEQRNDWREGLRGHTKISASSKGAANATDAAELRFAMSGVTAAASAGGTKGLIRNVDTAGMLEAGLVMPLADSDTFPLDDGSLKDAPVVCSGWSGTKRTTAASIAAYEGYLPHISEGINASAHAELTCLSTDPKYDLIQRQTAVIHGVAVGPQDTALSRRRGSILVWSPRSNVDLYGNTAPIALYAHAGVPIALGTDWLPSGSMNMARELKCADDLNTRYFGKALTDKQLWEAVTINAAFAVGAQHQLGMLKPGYLGDIAIFDATNKDPYRAVIEAGVEDTVLVLRAGAALYGDSELVKDEASGGGSDCEALTVCNYTKLACVKKDLVKKSLADLQTAADSVYPLYFCKDQAVKNEPSCAPTRGPTDGEDAVGTYAGITGSDKDGDGVDDDVDDCPNVFDPIRPMDNGAQADTDGDGIGDACDRCPLESGEGCTPPDADDMDGDGVPNWSDNCPEDANADQSDADGDGKGAACDKDGAGNACDGTANPGSALCPQPYSISDLRRASDPGHPTPGKTRAILTGVWVTGVKTVGSGTQGFFVQEGTSQYSGMFVAQTAPTVVVGNRVDVTGDYTEVFAASQLSNAVVTVVEATTALPFGPVTVDPDVIADGANAFARGEPWESMLVHVQGPIAISVVNPDDNGATPTPDFDEFAVGTSKLRVDDNLLDALDNRDPVGTTFAKIDGICAYDHNARKIWPRSFADIVKP